MVEVLMESGGQEVFVPETGDMRAETPTEYALKLNSQPIPIHETKINDDNRITSIDKLTRIQEFYYGQSVFITGGTGFLGKLLIEKLLRSCSNLSFIYLLVRPKKGKDVHQRIEELFDDPVFAKLKEKHPKFRHQIVAVSGDCSQPGLGLSPNERALLQRDVSIVFHVAATVKFDENLKVAVSINVQSPKDILNLCREMPKLKAYVYVSTAYANCVHKNIEEKFYDPPMDRNKLITLVECIDNKLAGDLTKQLLGKWPNTYTFTKAIAEDIVRKEGNDLPIGIFRPAVVISTYQEPIRGWIDNMYGPTGVAAGAGTGLLRSLHCDGSLLANVVPGDMTVNALIATAWDVANTKRNNENDCEIPIYNYVSKDNPITWNELKDMSAKYGLELPTIRAVWYYSFGNTKNKFVHLFYVYFLHLLPALLIDTVTVCIGKKPRMLKMYKKVHKFMEVLDYFTTKKWTFTNDHVRNLVEKLDSKDRSLFNMDMKDIVWDTYFQYYIRGIRLYLIKDPMDTLPQARIKWQRMYWIHQVIKIILIYGFLRFFWLALKTLISIIW